MKTTQIILYNQLRENYLSTDAKTYLYIHHTGKILFQGEELNLNIASKIIDYAGGKNLVEELKNSGKKADFVTAKSFYAGLKTYAKKQGVEKYILVKPVENYVYQNFLTIGEKLENIGIELELREDTQSFFLSHTDFEKQYKKPPIMEYFYRFMRKKEDIMMNADGTPEGGEWNYDAQNRKFERKHEGSWSFSLEKNSGLLEAEEYYKQSLRFPQPTSREEALELLDYFITNHLDTFGKLEDAMYQDDPYVHHSMLSASINYGLLSPREVVSAVEQSSTALNNKEGFIRQVLGWREYMYHFFQHYKDSLYTENGLNHTRSLPEYFWKNGKNCSMNCLSTTLQQVQKENISHHIQRLMIIGNFSLLTGLNPHELNKWFFEYYFDAFEWVVTPNVLGMSQYADSGKLATKPYIASANYVNKMSDYCKNCKYDPKQKDTEDACPLNYLYWNFVDKHKGVFQKGRQHFVLKNLEKVDIQRVRELSKKFLERDMV